MTILQALNSYYDRMAARGEVAPTGYSVGQIHYEILLSPDGEIADVNDIRDTSGKKPVLRKLAVPTGERSRQILAKRLWDNSAYVLGVTTKDDNRLAQKHEAFKAVHSALLADTEDTGLLALRRFLERWKPEHFEISPHLKDEMKDTDFVFRLDGERQFIHDRPAARAMIAAEQSEGGDDFCLVTGQRSTAARLHFLIKGVAGPPSPGARIVSFNDDAFESYGKKQGANSPISEDVAVRYSAALNALLEMGKGHRVQIGDATTVFWADANGAGGETAAEAADEWAAHFVDPPTDREEAAKIRPQLEAVAKGRPVSDLNPSLDAATRFYILGLVKPNKARLSVRFWYDGTFGDLEQRIHEHWQDMAITPPPKVWPPSAWHLLIESAAQHKSENIPPLLGGELMRAILNGTRYPRSLMSAILIRIRAEQGEVSPMRAAILRGILARDYRLGFEQKEVPVALDEQDTTPAYRLGRWFAELEAIQQHALPGLNATIRDRFYGSASSAPARTFPVLIRNAMNHLATLRKEGKAGGHEKRLEAIIAGVDHGLPRSLRIEDQARFAIGYYHQRAERFTKSTDTNETAQGEETAS
ncbi:MAG: type I-C CRISPR-associated protein Cas8c/Csd1 [Pseudomonadota bacterium]